MPRKINGKKINGKTKPHGSGNGGSRETAPSRLMGKSTTGKAGAGGLQRGHGRRRPYFRSRAGYGPAKRDEVFDLIPSPVVVMDRDHTILNLNPTAAQAAGRSVEDCIGLKFWDLFDNPGCRAGTCAAAQAMRTGVVSSGEARPMVQGKELPVRVVAAPRYDANHQIVGVVEIVHDASEENRLNLEIIRLVEAARGGKLGERGKAAISTERKRSC